jgi:hypothetical protein
MARVRFDFGKHSGRPVEDVPTSYLRWCLRECECLTPWLRSAIDAELGRRAEGARRRAERDGDRHDGRGRPPADWPVVIGAWYRELALQYHPDRGGTTRDMQIVNDCVDRLRRLVGVA